MEYIEKLKNQLLEDRNVIGWITHDGFISIEPRQQKSQLKFHHVLYDSVPSELVRIEQLLGQKLPEEYKKFLIEINGAKLFSGENNIAHLSLHGIWPHGFNPNNTNRGLPFDLLTLNHFSRLVQMPTGDLTIGAYAWDGACVCISAKDESVYVRPREENTSLTSWSSFKAYLFSEIDRLSSLFDVNLEQKDINLSTSPVAKK